jgi:hypothetical protein
VGHPKRGFFALLSANNNLTQQIKLHPDLYLELFDLLEEVVNGALLLIRLW